MSNSTKEVDKLTFFIGLHTLWKLKSQICEALDVETVFIKGTNLVSWHVSTNELNGSAIFSTFMVTTEGVSDGKIVVCISPGAVVDSHLTDTHRKELPLLKTYFEELGVVV